MFTLKYQNHKIKRLFSICLLSYLLFTLPIGSGNADISPPKSILHSTIIYVDKDATGGSNNGTDWANAYLTVQSALNSAGAGSEIWVAEGVYTPTDPAGRDATFQLVNGVKIYGGFAGTEASRDQRDWNAHVTILSGDIGTIGDNSDNAYHVVTGSGADNTAILDGFTITAGNASEDISPCGPSCGGGILNNAGNPTLSNLIITENLAYYQGGGIWNNNGSPILTNVTFTHNTATWGGGGIYNKDNSNPSLTNVVLTENFSNYGGGIFNFNSSPTLTNVTISGNSVTYNGGGMYNDGSNPTLTNVTLSGNSAYWGGGIYNIHSSNPTLTNVILTGNSASQSGGGMRNETSNPSLTNVIFSGNSADYSVGGAMDNYDNSHPTLTNVTISGNSAVTNGGGIHNKDSAPTLSNVIVWGNQDSSGVGTANASIYNINSTSIISFSLVQGYSANLGDPLFVDPIDPATAPTVAGNLRLFAGSPVLDAGSNIALPADSFDLDGDGNTIEQIPFDIAGTNRILSGTVDMGAYEGASINLKPSIGIPQSSLNLSWDIGTNCSPTTLYESNQPYKLPPNGTAYTNPPTPADTSMILANRLGDPATNYFYYLLPAGASCPYLLSNHVGEFDFTIVPGTS